VRDWTGYVVSDIGDPALRDKLARITYYLSDLSKAMGRIQQGQVPDGSGDAIASLTDDGFYFKLKGRSGGQWAHGDTGPGGTLTLSSTYATTKGLIYLGDAHDSAYDEVNDRLGIGEVAPDAKLHITVGAVSGTTALPTSGSAAGIDWGYVGGADYSVLADSSDSTYIVWTVNAGGLGQANTFQGVWTGSLTDPVVRTGFNIYITARGNSSASNSTMILLISNGSGSGYFKTIKLRGPNDTANPGADIALTTSFVRYPVSISAAELAGGSPGEQAIDFGTQPFKYAVSFSGLNSGSGTFDFSKIEFEIPPAGGALGDTLQKWENPTYTNELAYAADGLGATTLQLSGTPPLRLTTAPEFDVGTPVVNHLWTAADTEGTGQWLAASAALSAYASALPTKVPYSWEANGPYRAGAEVDGGRTVPRAMMLLTARMYRKTAGAAGSTQVDVLKNGSTTMLAAPITIGAVSGNAVTASAALIATPTLAAGDWLSCSAVAVETGMPMDWAVVVEGY